MNFRTKNNNVVKALYIVLVMCIIAVMAVSIYSIIKRGQEGQTDNGTTNAGLMANTTGSDAEEMLRIFDTTKKTTEAATTPAPTTPAPTTPAPTTPAPTNAPDITETASSDSDSSGAAAESDNSILEVISIPSIFIKPAAGEVSKYFNIDMPEYSFAMNDYRTHNGIDIECEVGTPVCAVAAGVVTGVYEDPMMGYTIVIDHGGGLQSVYMNLQPNVPQNIKEGFIVKGNEVIGGVGESALIEAFETPHLHFEMYKDGEAVNPLDYIIN